MSFAPGPLAGLVRAWIAIVAEQPPFARVLLLVLVLATLALYALGLVSTAVRARLPTVPADEPTRVIVRQSAVAPAPAWAVDPTETPAPPALPEIAPPEAAGTRSPQLRSDDTAEPTATLEPTPTQDTRPVATPPPTPRPTTPALVPPSPTPAPPTSTPTPRPPPPAPAPAGALPASAGTLGPGGTFAKSELAYPGDRSVYTVNVHVEPDDAGVLKNAGFIVYGPNGEEVVRGGAQPGRRPNVSANVITTRAGRYTVQVQNYDPARSITYRLEVVAGPPG